MIFILHLAATTDFVLIGCHTDPDTAVQEINSLSDVHAAVKKRWKTDNILIMGDLNAGCAYASKSRLKEVNTRNDPKFVWYIADDADTTTKSTRCAYDRSALIYLNTLTHSFLLSTTTNV